MHAHSEIFMCGMYTKKRQYEVNRDAITSYNISFENWFVNSCAIIITLRIFF